MMYLGKDKVMEFINRPDNGKYKETLFAAKAKLYGSPFTTQNNAMMGEFEKLRNEVRMQRENSTVERKRMQEQNEKQQKHMGKVRKKVVILNLS